jgi:soluble lytic murein transglycosylase-like protein
MIKETFICLALLNMNNINNAENICNNITSISKITKQYNIDSYTFVSILWVESRFKQNIKSYTGRACGISQVVPKWTRPRKTCKELNESIPTAIAQGARIFSVFKRYGKGNLKISLCGYNQGYRCKGEVQNKNYDYKEKGFEYAEKVIKFRNKLKHNVIKQKRKFKSYGKILVSALKNLY